MLLAIESLLLVVILGNGVNVQTETGFSKIALFYYFFTFAMNFWYVRKVWYRMLVRDV